MSDSLFAGVVAIAAALVGYAATYINNVRLNQRQARLDRINRQLSELYGPLLAIRGGTEEAYSSFREAHGFAPDHFRGHPSDEDWEKFELWVTTVFMPNHRRMYETILTKSDLLIGNDMPPVLVTFCAHVLAWEVVTKRWENNDFRERSSVVPFPEELYDYIKRSFATLKAQQSRLIGDRPPTR